MSKSPNRSRRNFIIANLMITETFEETVSHFKVDSNANSSRKTQKRFNEKKYFSKKKILLFEWQLILHWMCTLHLYNKQRHPSTGAHFSDQQRRDELHPGYQNREKKSRNLHNAIPSETKRTEISWIAGSFRLCVIC